MDDARQLARCPIKNEYQRKELFYGLLLSVRNLNLLAHSGYKKTRNNRGINAHRVHWLLLLVSLAVSSPSMPCFGFVAESLCSHHRFDLSMTHKPRHQFMSLPESLSQDKDGDATNKSRDLSASFRYGNRTDDRHKQKRYRGNARDTRVRLQSNDDLPYEWDITLASFNMDLQNLAMENPTKAHDAVCVMQEMFESDPLSNTTVNPDAACYTTILDGYIHAGELASAQEILDTMEELASASFQKGASTLPTKSDTTTQNAPFILTELPYILMAQAWAEEFRHDYTGQNAEKAVSTLRRMQATTEIRLAYSSQGHDGSTTTSSMVKVWSIVVEGWCKRAGIARQAMERAENLLLEMEDDNPLVSPNVLTYTSYICGLARSKDPALAIKAEAVLNRMEKHGVQPDVVAYTAVINCWAKSTSRRERGMAASRALAILADMERLYIRERVFAAKPSAITYATAIAAIGNSLDREAPQLAQDVLQRMEKLRKSGAIANLKPGTSTYNAVIYALSRAPVSNRSKYAKRSEQILDEMTQRAQSGEKDVLPDVRTWASVLRAWTRSKELHAAENAQRVLEKMEYRYRKGLSSVRPNFVCYTTVMGAWGYSKSKGNLDKMETILKRMEKEYEETMQADSRPNTVSYVTCIDAFVRNNAPDAAQRAQATVDRMMQLYGKGLGHVRPTRIVFNVLINAWSRSKSEGSAKKAEQIFKLMEAHYRAGDDLIRPDEVTLCAVLNAWANQAEHGGAERAQQIWEHIESVSVGSERVFRPTIAMANIVIKAIARSKNPEAVYKAESILIRLEEDYESGKSVLCPDVTTYSSVINACAYCIGDTSQRRNALQIALRTYYKLSRQNDEGPNNITYGTVFKAIQNLMPVTQERENIVRDLFDQCSERGVVDYFVLSQVRYASPKLYRELVEGPCGLGGPATGTDARYGITTVLKNIPIEWTANVVE